LPGWETGESAAPPGMNIVGGGRDDPDAFEPGGLGARAVSEELVERAQRVSSVFGEFAVKREGEHVAAIEDRRNLIIYLATG